jgi:hypothetical protein
MNLDIDTLLKFLNSGGILGLLLVIVYSGQRGIWVWRREVDGINKQLADAKADAEEWKIMALRGTSTAERISTTTKDLVTAFRAAVEPEVK